MNSWNLVTSLRPFLLSTAGAAAAPATRRVRSCPQRARSNIPFFLSDDQSWLDCSAYGNSFLRTPHLDRLAREGVRFTQAFVSTPSCTPSRAAICTGRNFRELGRGSVLHSPLPRRYVVYQDLMEDAGYAVGYTDKGWGPGEFQGGGRERNPAGPSFDRLRVDPPLPREFSSVDDAANFARFLENRPPDSSGGRSRCWKEPASWTTR